MQHLLWPVQRLNSEITFSETGLQWKRAGSCIIWKQCCHFKDDSFSFKLALNRLNHHSQTEQYSTFTQGSERSGIFPHAMIPFVHTCSCRHYRDTGTYTHIQHIDCRGTPPLQAHFYPNEWSRSRSKLINVPTAPERFLVRWQQCLLTAEEY